MSIETHSPIPEIPTLVFKDHPFSFIKDRRNGTKIFGADNGESFLRFGPAKEIEKELTFHKHLIEQGYPVPSILEEGEWHVGEKYYLETSAGDEKFGIIFKNDVADRGAISDETFNDFIGIIQRYIDAQQRSEVIDQDWESVFIGTHFDRIIQELPDQENRIMAVWQKVKSDLANVPFVLCHGDFNAHNIFPGGVIDFETAFNGPKGYDVVSAAASIEWFPAEGDFEMTARHSFTAEQKQSLLELQVESTKYFNALFMLRSVWAVVGMHKFPKIQAWRYAKFQKLMDTYLAR